MYIFILHTPNINHYIYLYITQFQYKTTHIFILHNSNIKHYIYLYITQFQYKPLRLSLYYTIPI